MGAELALQESHTLVCVPRTEKVPAAQSEMTASVVAVHCDVTRWPGPAVEHVPEHGVPTVSVPYTDGTCTAEYVPVPHGVHTRSDMPPAAAE